MNDIEMVYFALGRVYGATKLLPLKPYTLREVVQGREGRVNRRRERETQSLLDKKREQRVMLFRRWMQEVVCKDNPTSS